MLMRFALLCGLCAAGTASAGIRYAHPDWNIYSYGIYCADYKAEVKDAPDTATGYISTVAGKPEIEHQTDQIPIFENLSMGFYYGPEPDVLVDNIRFHISHPPYRNAEGQTQESFSVEFDGLEARLNGFRFEFPFEMVPGTWTMTLMQEDVTLIAMDFFVRRPREDEAMDDFCKREDMLS